MSTPDTPPPLVGGHAPQFQLLFWLVGLWVNIFKSYTKDLLAGRGNPNSQKTCFKSIELCMDWNFKISKKDATRTESGS